MQSSSNIVSHAIDSSSLSFLLTGFSIYSSVFTGHDQKAHLMYYDIVHVCASMCFLCCGVQNDHKVTFIC